MLASTLNSRRMRSTRISRCKLTHTGDNRLAGFFIGFDAEGGILLSQFTQSDAHLLLVSLRLRLHRH